jgi:23S rRNA (uracil1939-C5)-methyltransferase
MEPPFAVGDTLDVTIDRLAYGGDGVAHPDSFATFVPRTAPGDKVRIQVTDVRRRYARALPVELLQSSPHRIEPACPQYSQCGGCHYQHLEPSLVLKEKEAQIRETFLRLGSGDVPLLPLRAPGDPWHYRNRVTYHRDSSGRQGYMAWKDFTVLDIEDCPVAREPLNELWREVRENLKDVAADTVSFVVLRGTEGGQRAVILSLSLAEGESVKLEEIKEHTAPLAAHASVWVTRVKLQSRTPFGKEMVCLHPPNVLVEEWDGIRFHLRPDLFFQVNATVAREVAADLVKEARAAGPEKALDLYCGAGLFTLFLARAGIPTLGVEVHYPSVQAAQTSALENGLSGNARFRAGKADRILERLERDGERFPLAVADPPRKGLEPRVLEFLPRLGVKTLLYVSCSPPTMARDFKVLAQQGFRVKSVQPYDMFPHTYHVELLGVLSRD